MSADSQGTTSLLYAVKRLELVIRAELDEMLADSVVTTPQYTALTVLQARGEVSGAQLARDSFVTPQAMADMLRALQRHDLIVRTPNPASRREVLVSLSEQGRVLLDGYAAPAHAIEQRMLSGLSEGDVRRFRRALASTRTALTVSG